MRVLKHFKYVKSMGGDKRIRKKSRSKTKYLEFAGLEMRNIVAFKLDGEVMNLVEKFKKKNIYIRLVLKEELKELKNTW